MFLVSCKYNMFLFVKQAFGMSTISPNLQPQVIKGLGRFPKIPENTFIPVHEHVMRPRTRSCVTMWSLPEELILHQLKWLHVRDLLNMRRVHSYFRDVIDNSNSLWACVNFQDSWPCVSNLKHFEKAANCGNIEALVKLAIAYLYNEGLPADIEGKKITNNGVKAADMFCKLEGLTPQTTPFTWLFSRPPWSMNGACCKECVFTYMKTYLEHAEDRQVQICVAKTLQLLEDAEKQAEALVYLQSASDLGSGVASYLLWQQKEKQVVHDRASQLSSIRELRNIASLGHLDAQLALCKAYATGKFGGTSIHLASNFCKEFIQSSVPTNIQEIFKRNQELSPSMRYILVDWLVEVAGMKDFSGETLHVAINVVDRYLLAHPTTRSKLQLLGVAAMVLCSRFLGKDIITIREAAWLTDNTYKYEDVVRMMGEITATLRGNIRIATSRDYLELIALMADCNQQTTYLANYICELTLLHSEMGRYSQSELAASAVLLAKILTKSEVTWGTYMESFTGFSIEDLSCCAFHMHEKCFLKGSVVDHRDVTLHAIKQRYSEEKFHKVSSFEIMSYEDLCSSLGVTEQSIRGTKLHVKFRNAGELIVSPSRGKNGYAMLTRLRERDHAGTPTLDRSMILNCSALSGYDGDKEDDEDSALEYDDDNLYNSSFNDSTMGSEEDTYFATISNYKYGNASLSTEIRLPCFSSLRVNVEDLKDDCDNPSTSSGVSSSPALSGHHYSASVTEYSIISFGMDSEGTSSDSDSERRTKSNRKCAQLKSPRKSHSKKVTLKRKSRRQLGNPAKTVVIS